MRKYLFLLLIALSFNGYGQDTRFGIRSIEQNNGVSTAFSNYYEFGLDLGLGITAKYDQHLFALRFNTGGEVAFLSSAVNQYYTINFMYGRELSLNNWLVLEGFAGIGYVNFNKENIDTNWMRETSQALNLPIGLNVLFVTGDVFSMGVNPNININSFKMFYAANLIFQFRFR